MLCHPLIKINSELSMALQMPSIYMTTSSSKVPCFGKPVKKHWRIEQYAVCCNGASKDGGSLDELPMEVIQSTTSAEAYLKSKTPNKFKVGSPIIVIEAPRWIKTATAMPSLRVNSGHINAGDVGRIMSRKPKDVWAVRFRIGTYLIDGKYFEPLELEEDT